MTDETTIEAAAPKKKSGFVTPTDKRKQAWQDSAGRRKVKMVYDLVGLAYTRERHTPKRAAECLKGKAFTRWQGPGFADRLGDFALWVSEVAAELRKEDKR